MTGRRMILIALGLLLVGVFSLFERVVGYGPPEPRFSLAWWNPTTQQGELGFLPQLDSGPRDFAVGADGQVYVADTLRSRVLSLSTQGELLEFPIQVQGETLRPDHLAVSPDAHVWVATEKGYIFCFSPDGTQTAMFRLDPPPETVVAWAPQRLVCLSQDRLVIADCWIDGKQYSKRVAVYDREGRLMEVLGGFTLTPGGSVSSPLEGKPPQRILDLSGRGGSLFFLSTRGAPDAYALSSNGVSWEVESSEGQPRLLGVDERQRLHVLMKKGEDLWISHYGKSGHLTGQQSIAMPSDPWQASINDKGDLYIAVSGKEAYSVCCYPLRENWVFRYR